ncbi:hypothetical protein RB653_010536 [Dictyostelium firmibasis]|uniref:Uncharacterized protein n=1 Tax=Dictyostelium firmibasis TaxID=79012 RepID=A0AAN7TLQ8_9MYCE
MIKQTISILLLVVILNFSNAFEKTYLNFIPFETSDCSGNPSGIGYGAVIDTCFTFDSSRNWLFNNINRKENTVSYTQYYNKGGVSETCQVQSMPTETSTIGECVAGKTFNFNSFYQPVKSSQEIYYQIEVTDDSPYIVPDSYVISNKYGGCNDTDSDPITIEYFTNQTQVFISIFGASYEFYCLDDTPMFMTCSIDGNNCSDPQSQTQCSQISPFFNTTEMGSSGDSLYFFDTTCY